MPAKKKIKVAAKKPVRGKKAKKVEKIVKESEEGRGKRKRRESKSYEPDDFTMASVNSSIKIATVDVGRGKKLGDIEVVKDSMKKYNLSSEELLSAYKFVFSSRGVSNKKMMKDKLLEFSGYLPPLPKGKFNQEKLDEDDEVIETKYSIKAFKMNVSQLKTLCNFFGVDYNGADGKALHKDDIVDRLLDFLGAPDESMVREQESPQAKKKTATKAKKTEVKPKVVIKTVTEDPFSLIKDYKKGKAPNDKAMRQWVKAYIVCVDMETATTKDAVKTASAKFGVDMTKKKARIKELLAEEI